MALSPDNACCPVMSEQLDAVCDMHADRNDCPDQLVRQLSDGRTGLIVRDGGTSVTLIAFCPWCGQPIGTTIDD